MCILLLTCASPPSSCAQWYQSKETYYSVIRDLLYNIIMCTRQLLLQDIVSKETYDYGKRDLP